MAVCRPALPNNGKGSPNFQDLHDRKMQFVLVCQSGSGTSGQ